MVFDKIKSGNGVQLGVDKKIHKTNTGSQLIKHRKSYQPPKLILLETGEIEGGTLHLQEADGTGFVS